MSYRLFIISFLLCATIIGCKKDSVIPKPNAQLRLEYNQGMPALLQTDAFTFQYNKLATAKAQSNLAYTLEYSELRGNIFLSYEKVDNDIKKLIYSAKKLSYEHAAKADNIIEQPYVNKEDNVYGALFVVEGNAASQVQFYATDSTNHFLTGSVYFHIKPNYDSILPAATYLQNDIRGIMESLRWK